MAAYMIFQRQGPVRDQAAMDEYLSLTMPHAQEFGAKYGLQPLVVYGALEGVEGMTPDGAIILQFPTMSDAKAWYNSPEYQRAAPHRARAADYQAFIVEGL